MTWFRPFFNIKDFGAVGNGTANDAPAIQAAINAAIAATSGGVSTGAEVFMPNGEYKITTVLDFSALKGTNAGLVFRGVGSGWTGTQGGGATIISNATGGTAILAQGVLSGNQTINSISLRDFGIRNTVALASNTTYTVFFDLVNSGFELTNILINGRNLVGSGIAITNPANGQGRITNVQCRQFRTGTGIRISSEVTASVGTAPNSGNIDLSACIVSDVLTGWDIVGPGNLLNGMVFSACKAVNVTDVVGSIGFKLGTNATQNTFVSCHAERFSTGFSIADGRFNTFISPLTSYPSGTPDANSAGFRFSNTAMANQVINHRTAQTHYGVSFEGSAQSNQWSGFDITGGRVLTSLINDTSTLKTNATLRLEDGAVAPVWSLPGYVLSFSGLVLSVATKTANYTITPIDYTVLGDATSGAITITLPTAVGAIGRTYIIKRTNSGANNVTITTTSSQTIDGVTTFTLSNQYDTITVVSDGANWMIT
jgi:hypothetical protein